MGVMDASPVAIGTSSATESGITASLGASTSSGAAALVSVLPMGADVDSALFAAALNAAGGQYLGVAAEHITQRALFASSQQLASVTYTTTETIRSLTASLDVV